jgi:uncharacterized protein YjcR
LNFAPTKQENMSVKSEMSDKRELARLYYMQGETQRNISEKLTVSTTSLVRWVKEGGWDKKRAQKSMSRREIIDKLLSAVDMTIDLVKECAEKIRPEDPMKAMEILLDLPKKLYGFADQIYKLDKKDNVLDLIEYFNGFNTWIEVQALSDKRLTREILDLINEYQDKYIDEKALESKN